MTRTAPPLPSMVMARWTKIAALVATSVLVRSPAVRWRNCLS